MKNKLCTFLFTIILCLLLSGCYDIKEIDETAYIVALGIDTGENSNFSYTFQFSSPLAISGSEEGNSPAPSQKGKNSTVTNLTVHAPDFYIARNLTNNFMSKNVDMSHLKLIVFSSSVSMNALENHSQLLLREREIRPHTSVAVSSAKASEFLEKVNPELESNTSKYYELMSLRSNNVYAPTKRLHDFVDQLTNGNCDTVLPIAVSGKDIAAFPADNSTEDWISTTQSLIDSDSSVLCGMAIFKKGKLSGAMDGDSSMIYNILNRNIENCTVTVRNKHRSDNTISFRIIIPDKANFKINKGNRTVTVSQNIRAEFLGSILPEGYHSFDELYCHLQNTITNRTTEFLIDISKEKKADILNLREKIRPQFLTQKDWEGFKWQEFYSDADFTVNINLI